MLHHNHGISQIPKVLQCGDQPIIVPLVQSDTGLIQNIGHAHQAGADLGGQSDTLGLTAGQGTRRPGQAQIVQPYIQHEAAPRPDLPDHQVSDLMLGFRQLQLLQPVIELFHGKLRQRMNVQLSDGHRQR